ncbi:unnamed protein product [Hymenolepis diminuta]|uniref:Uncharacterized protein n=1 Tax=Hymenolepis diminuta TaxID=6216 RepID=A0A564XZZ6_HYMDI|nr:unnamed protein product [Hymenolepis diminuta]
MGMADSERRMKLIRCDFRSDDSVDNFVENAKMDIQKQFPKASISQNDSTLIVDVETKVHFWKDSDDSGHFHFQYPIEEVDNYNKVIFRIGSRYRCPMYSLLD